MTGTATRTLGSASSVRFHPLTMRVSDDDPETYVVGRAEVGEFVELPAVGVEAVRRLDDGKPLGDVEAWLATEFEAEVDLAEFVTDLVDAGFVSVIDGQAVADPHQLRPSHLPWLTARHVGWLFGTPAKLVYAALVAVTAFTLVRRPELLPTFRDFYWTEYSGLAVLVNTVLFSAAATLHELSHLAAARSWGAPARISFSTRLHHLVMQTDVTAVWSVPRKKRYRVYLSGLFCDLAVVCVALLVIAYAEPHPLVGRLLGALVVTVVIAMVLQAHVYMRTDLYFVLLDLLRCRNLFQDGLAHARHLAARAGHAVLPRWVPPAGEDPVLALSDRERWAVRCYAVAVVVGSTLALASFVLYGLPIIWYGVMSAGSAVVAGLGGDDLLRAADGAMLLLVEGTLQGIFLVTLYRRSRLSRRPRHPATDERAAATTRR
ncbi:PqqD family protein [Micromonospora sp. NPDC047730]|uniref:PqqD family protein n=1 Tax=Micromonospora sp. NPDC047730 TaxID=3364253 RepID=UPI003714A3E1